MMYKCYYKSIIGKLTLGSDGENLTFLLTEDENLDVYKGKPVIENPDLPIFVKTRDWLDRYFAGEKPLIDELPLAPEGSDFRQIVWKRLREIPYGQVVTYGDIAAEIAAARGIKRMAAQAVGGAVGSNPISVIIPCHRVIGAGGNLTGFGGGIDKKIVLLRHENTDMSGMYIPKKGTKL